MSDFAKSKKPKSPQSPNRNLDEPYIAFDVRVKFKKVGRLQFISHLDLNRTMKTALVRAGIPLKYSEGFNPHPRISFALQLSVGCESVCEYMELKLAEEPDCEKIKDELNKNLPAELEVEEVYVPTRKAKEIMWAEYIITYEPKYGEAMPDFKNIITNPFVVHKTTKSGEKDVDIRPQILEYKQDGSKLTVIVNCDSASYLNPEYIAKAANIGDYSIMRTRVFLFDGVTEFR